MYITIKFIQHQKQDYQFVNYNKIMETSNDHQWMLSPLGESFLGNCMIDKSS